MDVQDNADRMDALGQGLELNSLLRALLGIEQHRRHLIPLVAVQYCVNQRYRPDDGGTGRVDVDVERVVDGTLENDVMVAVLLLML